MIIIAASTVERRLRPLYAVAVLQNLWLWVPIEKLFMTSIGFDAASVGVMAAAYAAVVPLLEVPSGVLADRWSRRGVLCLASLALAVSMVIGGLSTNVTWYVVSALFLGVYIAMFSGTFEAIAYDTLQEETGSSDRFEPVIGRIRALESGALVVGALAGGALAEIIPLRATYFLTVPFVLGSAIAALLVREPGRHGGEAAESLREQLAATFRTFADRGRLRPVIALLVLSGLVLQALLEFGPLWLVALAAPPFVYGPHWAGLTAALGLGGLLGSRRRFTTTPSLIAVAVTIVASCVVLVVSASAAVSVLAQVVLTLLMMAISIPLTRRLQDSIASNIRAGVSSGVSTLGWLTFLPFALIFGVTADRAGVRNAGWLLVLFGVGTAVLLIAVLRRPRSQRAAVPSGAEPVFDLDRFLPAGAQWPGHWADPPEDWIALLKDRQEDPELSATIRTAVAELPENEQQVVVLRDVKGRSSAEVCLALGLDADTERALLHQARGRLRTRLQRYVSEPAHE